MNKFENTSNYSIEDVEVEVVNCQNILNSLGYITGKINSIVWNTRAKKRLGECVYKGERNGERIFNLNFNKIYFNIGTPEAVHSTIMHEVIHTIPGCFDHKKKFKEVSDKVRKYGYEINRTTIDTNYNEFLLENITNFNYEICCPICDRVLCKRIRKTRMIRDIKAGKNNWRCPVCKSSRLVVRDI